MSWNRSLSTLVASSLACIGFAQSAQAFATCRLPTVITDGDLETWMMSTLGNVIGAPDSGFYWYDGYAKVKVKTSGEKPVFHVDAKLKAHVDGFKDPVLLGDTDITVSCGTNAAGATGITLKPNKLKIEVSPGGVLGGLMTIAGIEAKFALAAPDPVFIETGVCPTFGTSEEGNLLMTWPNLTTSYPKVTYSTVNGIKVPVSTTWVTVAAPINPMCIDRSTIKLK
jgi:hypothetical protein